MRICEPTMLVRKYPAVAVRAEQGTPGEKADRVECDAAVCR